jgi:hypothetical protein
MFGESEINPKRAGDNLSFCLFRDSERTKLTTHLWSGRPDFVGLPEKNFDLVVAQTYLHHILFLERVAEPSESTMAGESIRGD